ncbi:MAG: ABC transporter permease [Thermoleophilia bacterium]
MSVDAKSADAPQDGGRARLGLPEEWKRRAVEAVTGPGLWSRVIAVLIALLLAAPLILAADANPLEAYRAMLDGAFGSSQAFADVLNRADTFILLGLGIAISIRSGFFNVGAEGQLWLGALGSTIVVLYWNGPEPLVLLVALVAGFVFGALWSGLVAALKIFLAVDELISSLMLNYVAILLISYLTFGPMKAYRAGQTERLEVELPLIFGDRLHAGFLLALIAVVLVWLLVSRTRMGYEMRTLGTNPDAARYAGISANRLIARVSLLSGGLCGLAGANAILGVQHVLLSDFSPGWGYTAIAVALLGGLTAFGVLLASILFGALEIGATNMQFTAGVPSSLSSLIEGLILVVFLISIPFNPARLWERAKALASRRRTPGDGEA